MELRLGPRALVVAVLAVVVAIAGVAGFFLTREVAQDDEHQTFLRALTPAQAGFDGSISNTVVGFSRLGNIDPEQLASTADSVAGTLGLDAIVQVMPDGKTASTLFADAATARGIGLDAPEGLPAALEPAFEVARDTATVRASAPVLIGGQPATLLVLPHYRGGLVPATTAARRVAVDGFVVGVLRPDVAARAFTALANDGARVEVVDGSARLFRTGPESGSGADGVRTRLSVAGRTWAIAARPGPADSGALPWLVLFGGIAMAAGLVVFAVRIERDQRHERERARARDEDLGVIAGLGPLLQQSLDLAEVLPAAASFFADRFDLDGLSITYLEGNILVEAYSIGRRPAGMVSEPAALKALPGELAAGETASVSLLRGGRLMGAMFLTPRSALGPQRTSTLIAVSEMLGTALANARQFEREQESVRRLQELDRLKHEFLGTVSHELQTPITAIMGFSSILNEQFEDIPPEQRRDYLARVVRNAESLSGLVHQLLDFSRLGRRSFDLHPEEIDISALADQIVHQFATLIERHRLDVVSTPGVWAVADPEAVERILTNLLSNAAKYSPAGSLVTLTVEPVEHGARLIVDDAGPGISEADRPHIFDRFYRGNSPAAVASRGAGIGLAVVKDLVERMHGTITVDTAPTGGARFTVVLPAETDDSSHPPPSAPAEQGRLT